MSDLPSHLNVRFRSQVRLKRSIRSRQRWKRRWRSWGETWWSSTRCSARTDSWARRWSRRTHSSRRILSGGWRCGTLVKMTCNFYDVQSTIVKLVVLRKPSGNQSRCRWNTRGRRRKKRDSSTVWWKLSQSIQFTFSQYLLYVSVFQWAGYIVYRCISINWERFTYCTSVMNILFYSDAPVIIKKISNKIWST